MTPLRKTLLVAMPLLGVALCAGAHLAPQGTLLSAFGAKVSFLLLAASLVLAMLPARPAVAEEAEPVKPVPRTLSEDTLNSTAITLSLPERIEHAIALSQVQSRSFGVLSIKIGDYDAIARRVGAENAARALDFTAATLRKQLRASDRAAAHGKGEVLVCLPLIAVKRDLETIAARLSRKAAVTMAAQVSPGVEPAVDAGISMYPLGGYSGEELIASAQDDADLVRATRLGRAVPVRVDRADRGPAPVLPPRKPQRKPAKATGRARRVATSSR